MKRRLNMGWGYRLQVVQRTSDRSDIFVHDMGVYFGCLDVGMAHQILCNPHIRPVFKQLGRKRVAHMLENGTDLYTLKQLLGHTALSTTMGYLHLTPKRTGAIAGPLIKLDE